LPPGRNRIIILVLDNGGWHTLQNLAVPDGIRLVFGVVGEELRHLGLDRPRKQRSRALPQESD
jgi:hypothetical protein